MQYAHLYPAYVNSNGLAPLETNVIKSHDCKFLYVKIAAVSSHIIFHKKKHETTMFKNITVSSKRP